MIVAPRWILVDVGQVLIGLDHAVIGARLVAECFPADRQSVRDREAVQAFIMGAADGPSPNSQVDRGAKDIAWLCATVSERFGVAIDAAHCEEIWTSIFAPRVNADVMACVAALRTSGVRIALCSDTNAPHWRFLLRHHEELRRLADEATCFLSFEMGLGKGDTGFFERIKEVTQASAGSHLLLDDKPGHCLAAEGAGMHAVCFDPADAQRSLRAVVAFFQGGDDHGA